MPLHQGWPYLLFICIEIGHGNVAEQSYTHGDTAASASGVTELLMSSTMSDSIFFLLTSVYSSFVVLLEHELP